MKIHPNFKSENLMPRKGAMLIFVLFLLTIILAMVVYSVDVAFMQLTRTELHAATDAAAKAAAGELLRTDGDHKKARQAGKAIAQLNLVAGAPLLLEDSNFEFGQAVEQADGSWDFTPDLKPYTSVRVTGDRTASSKSGAVNLFFAPILGHKTFSPTHVSVASQFEQQLVLVIDRSHSMAFDDSGIDWSYPGGIGGSTAYFAAPHKSDSRWAQLQSAMKVFTDTVKSNTFAPDVGLITWASTFADDSYESRVTGEKWNAVEVDLPLGKNFDAINSVINGRGSRSMMGGTNLSAGIDAATTMLANSGSTTAKKSMIVMTDGQWNQGRDPVQAAFDAKALGLSIHTITFLDKADQTTMQQVAVAGGGRHYHASNASQLEAIFEELALALPVALTQ